MTVTKKTSFDISKKPGPMGIIVEATSFAIRSTGSGWSGVAMVPYSDNIINVTIAVRGQIGDDYEMVMTLNTITQKISGKLPASGINTIKNTFPRPLFNF